MTTYTLYRYYDASDRLLYVGATTAYVSRATQHALSTGWMADATRVSLAHYPTRAELFEAERIAIREEHPLHNEAHGACLACRPGHHTNAPRRRRGAGSVWQRTDGVWACAVSGGVGPDGKRIRRVLYGTSEADVLAKLETLQVS